MLEGMYDISLENGPFIFNYSVQIYILVDVDVSD